MLRKAKATCLGYDPKADIEELSHYRHLFERAEKIQDLVKAADGLVLVTEWPEFKDLPFQSLAKLMKKAVMIDSKNYLDPDLLASAGFDYQGFGRRRRLKRPED